MPPEPTTPSSPSQPIAEAIDLASVAALLSVSLSTAKQLKDDGRLLAPVMSIGRVIRWSKLELSAWILSGCPARVLWNQIREQSIRKFLAAKAA